MVLALHAYRDSCCVHTAVPLSSDQVYGRDTVFDADRLIDLLDAFETFTVASRSARGDMDLTEGGWMQTCLLHVA